MLCEVSLSKTETAAVDRIWIAWNCRLVMPASVDGIARIKVVPDDDSSTRSIRSGYLPLWQIESCALRGDHLSLSGKETSAKNHPCDG